MAPKGRLRIDISIKKDGVVIGTGKWTCKEIQDYTGEAAPLVEIAAIASRNQYASGSAVINGSSYAWEI